MRCAINGARTSADAERKRVMGALDDMAAGRHLGDDDSRRMVFGKAMAARAAAQMLGDGVYGKAVAPSGATTVGQEFEPSPVDVGHPANNLLAVLPVKTRCHTGIRVFTGDHKNEQRGGRQ